MKLIRFFEDPLLLPCKPHKLNTPNQFPRVVHSRKVKRTGHILVHLSESVFAARRSCGATHHRQTTCRRLRRLQRWSRHQEMPDDLRPRRAWEVPERGRGVQQQTSCQGTPEAPRQDLPRPDHYRRIGFRIRHHLGQASWVQSA